MIQQSLKQKFRRWHRNLQGSTIEYDLSAYQPLVHSVKAYYQQMNNLNDDQIKDQFDKIRRQVLRAKEVGEFLPQVFALVYAAVQRTLAITPFDVQLLGAIVMHHGRIAEMQTGEGKTLTAVFPAALNTLSGKGVHVLTFNDYLAKRDAQWMGPVYRFLGLSVGFVSEGMTVEQRQQAYQSDITYLTAKEAGFDYLRDGLCYKAEQIVQRPFYFVIIDEADSILIDEARIPLVIAGTVEEQIPETMRMSVIARQLEEGKDFDLDEYSRNIHLTDSGLKRVEQMLDCPNLYAAGQYDTLTRLYCAIHAENLLQRDIDYIIRENKIELVDAFTGRIADKRRWPDGLQAALEAKENINVQSRGSILNSITLQHFIRLYPKICGMTATACDSEGEFSNFYNLQITVIPPNKPCVRNDLPDRVFRDRDMKDKAIYEEIRSVNKTGRPVLVGTASVEESELLANRLKEKGIECVVLNAKNDQQEAQIIAEAGKLNAVTISTNMAGRGTDIKLGGANELQAEQVCALGGLYVIGTNKHESSRIDRQLRGRSGRQGDPGNSEFFVSLEDPLMKKYRLEKLLPQNNRTVNMHNIDNPLVLREVLRVQRISEGQNLEVKKTLNKYSGLVEQQRLVLVLQRQDILEGNAALAFFSSKSPENFRKLKRRMKQNELDDLCRRIALFHIDQIWSEYLANIADIRESIHLKRIGGQNPFFEFQKQAIQMFDVALAELDDKMVVVFESLRPEKGLANLDDLGIKAPSATWTYLVNDDPFENDLGLKLIGDTGLQISAGIWAPLLAIRLLFRMKIKDIND